jgi:formate dehydrogenase subunit gamma
MSRRAADVARVRRALAPTGAPSMSKLLARMRFIAVMLALASLVTFAAPLHAQQQTPFIDPDANAVSEQKLLQQSPRIEGRITIPDQRARVLEQPAGRQWDYFHEIILHWFGAIVIIGMVGLLAAAYYILGPLRISAGRSGRKVARFSAFERFVHWLTATSFIVLGITGLNVTFGKLLLRPVLGPEAFTAFAQAAKYAHNFTAFPFMLGILLIIGIWFKDNIPRKIDIAWFKQGGGFIKSKHPPAGRFNGGEKGVYWIVLGAGMTVSLSGLLLLFPFYLANIWQMQIAQVVHAVVAVLFVAVILAHIYIGTLGTEGAFEAMATGEVDLNWAKEHHNLWLEEELAKNRSADRLDHPAPVPAE